MLKNVTIIALLIILMMFSVSIMIEHSRFVRTKGLIECYDRVVDSIPKKVFIQYIANTKEWYYLERYVEENHVGCNCSKDILCHE